MASEGTPPARPRGRPRRADPEDQEWIRFREGADRKRRFEDAVLQMDRFGSMSATLRAFVSYFIGDTDEIPPRPEPKRGNPG